MNQCKSSILILIYFNKLKLINRSNLIYKRVNLKRTELNFIN
jgi:hypothetical protein